MSRTLTGLTLKQTGGLRHDQDLQHITRSFLRHAGNPRRVRKLLRKIEVWPVFRYGF